MATTTRYLRNKALMAKIEATYGVDPVPTGAANAILSQNDIKITGIQTDRKARDIIMSWMGNQTDIPVAARMMIEFDVEMAAGGGAVDLVPAWSPLLRGCGYAPTTNAGVSVVHKPITTGFESLTIYFNQDGELHKLLGCRGSVSFKTPPRDLPVMHFTFTGLYGGVVDAALTAQTWTAFKVPKPVNKANTPTFSLQGFAANVYDLSFDTKNSVVYRNMIGREDVVITDRAPDGSCEIEAPLIAEKDWFTAANTAAVGALQLIHGIGAGNVVQIDMPAVEVGDPVQSQRDNVVTYQLPLRITPSAGNDEISITTK
jgi:hypothetical protein